MILYDCPYAFLLLAILPLIVGAFFLLYRHRKTQLDSFVDGRICDLMMEKRRPLSFWSKVVLACIVWLGGVIALASPKGNEHYIHQNTSTQVSGMYQIIFLVDASASMSINDSRNGATRLEVAKEIADKIISGLNGENVALFAFTSATMQLAPITTDYLFTRLMLRQMEINEGETVGTDLAQAFDNVNQEALSLYNVPKMLVLLTDGGDPTQQKIEEVVQPLVGTKNLSTAVIAIGSKEGGIVPNVTYEGRAVNSKLNLPLLQEIASMTHGSLFMASELTSTQIAEAVAKQIVQKKVFYQQGGTLSSIDDRVYDHYFWVPLGVALVALLLFLLIPDTQKRGRRV